MSVHLSSSYSKRLRPHAALRPMIESVNSQLYRNAHVSVKKYSAFAGVFRTCRQVYRILFLHIFHRNTRCCYLLFFNTSLQEFCRKTGAPHLKAPCNFDMIPKQSLIDRAKPGLPTAAFSYRCNLSTWLSTNVDGYPHLRCMISEERGNLR